jgi:hypothetical protein
MEINQPKNNIDTQTNDIVAADNPVDDTIIEHENEITTTNH